MIVLITILAVLMAGLSLSMIYRKMEMTRLIVWAIVSFVFVYIINAALLFWIDRFSILLSVSLVLAEAVLLVIVLMIRKKVPSVSFQYKESIIPIIIFILILPVVFQKFGFFGMGQDQGVYQTKAIALIYGHNQNSYALEETSDMSPEEQQQYKDGISEQLGFYYVSNSADGAVQGVFHGINTYPAVLAWWGSMFGYEHMAGVNTLLILCCLFLIYDLGKLFGASIPGRAFITVVFGLSPIILWVNKSSLSENITILIFVVYLYLLFDQSNRKRVWLSAIPIAVYAVFHVTIYVMMPMFVLVYLAMFFLYGNRRYLVANIICLISYKLGHMMMVAIAWEYTFGNYDVISRLGLDPVRMENYSTIAVVVFVIISVLLIFLSYHTNQERVFADQKWLRVTVNWLIRIMIATCALFAVDKIRHSLYSYVNATMYAYVAATAVIMIPFILFILYFRTNVIYQSKKIFILTFIYLYCGIFFGTVLNFIVSYYNYYSRYIAAYLICVPLFAVVLLEQLIWMKQKSASERPVEVSHGMKDRILSMHTRTVVYIVLIAFVMLLYTRYDLFMVNKMDETRMEWDTLKEIGQQFDSEDRLIIDGDLKNQLFFTMKMISNCKTYPGCSEDHKQIDYIQDSGNYYYVTDQELTSNVIGGYDVLLDKVFLSRESAYNKETVLLGKLPYPLAGNTSDYQIYLYRIIK